MLDLGEVDPIPWTEIEGDFVPFYCPLSLVSLLSFMLLVFVSLSLHKDDFVIDLGQNLE
jgi:hypothetical protein